MTLLKRIYISIVCAFSVLLNLNAQTTSFITYGMEQGLVQNQVQSLIQDNEGNLWISTIAGITRYDGTHFNNFTHQHGLSEDWVTASFKDSKGNLWFGHWAGNITRFNVATQKFENLGFEEYSRFKSISDIIEDKEGRFWISTEGAGVYIYEPDENKMFSVGTKDGLTSNMVYDLDYDKNGWLWMATDSGITAHNTQLPITNPKAFIKLSKQNGLFSNSITCLSISSKNQLWIGSADKGISVIHIGTKSVEETPSLLTSQIVFGENSGIRSNFIKCLYEDKSGVMYVGTIGGGFSYFIPQENTSDLKMALEKGIFKTYSTREGLNYFNVNAILDDREGNVWIGTDLGINMFRGERIQVFDEADLIANNIVWGLCVDNENNIWCGTNNGLSKIHINYSNNGKTAEKTVETFNGKSGLMDGAILSCFEDHNGNLWFGTGFNGVYMKAKGSDKFLHIGKEKGIISDVVYSIAEDKDGYIWFGTKEGASRYETNSGSIRNFTTADGLGGDHVYRIFKDSKNLLWIGSLGGDLTSYDGSTFKKYNDDNGLRHRFILCINEDNNGNIWFGCYGGGLYKYDGKSFTNYFTNNGLKTESPFSVIADKQNNIWIGDNRGIEKFDVRKNTFTHYGRSEGFPGVECNPNAIAIDKNGNLWFGTIMGAVKFNPSEDKPNTVAPITRIYGIKIHLHDTLFPSDAIFKYNENNLTFKFIGVSLTHPEKIKYEYTLEGFDSGWIPAGKDAQEAVYTNLPSGKYVFKVRTYNNDGEVSEPAVYSFTVKPPFWQTALFYISVALFFIFSVYIFDKIRTARLKKANAELENKVEERTIQLAIKNEELAEKNKDITDSIRYAKRIQDSMLPDENSFSKHFQNHFIYFRPKDIVSGDFYWVHEKNNAVYVAAVDCTGHGVPGAFLSIVANQLLNQALQESKQNDPASVLNKLNDLASTALKTHVKGYALRDGMDLSLCKIDHKNGRVEFAGAYNNLYLVRQNRLIEYPSDHISIGSKENNKSYNNHTFEFLTGDKIYLFSDGFADQFGGEKGKKFKYNHFQELLVKINNQTMEKQREELDKGFSDWKGQLEQVDDVLVIGISL